MLKARKLSSAMSAAKAICDHMRDWWFGTPDVRKMCYSACMVEPVLQHISGWSFERTVLKSTVYFKLVVQMRLKKWGAGRNGGIAEWTLPHIALLLSLAIQ